MTSPPPKLLVVNDSPVVILGDKELLGGEFTLESKSGRGTRVTVELPLKPT
jgi:hypothetical protein